MGNKKTNSSDKVYSDLEYESMRDKALAMAYTLRKIDKELHLAAQSEGDYPGGYKSEDLLPNLCKIMYASEGYHRMDEMLTEKEQLDNFAKVIGLP